MFWRVLACVLVAAVWVAPAQAKKVDVGGYRLHFVQKGDGRPTVVFDSGLGDTHEVWKEVWPAVARRHRVFLYDRAGLGRSEPAPGPRTSDRMADELHRLLQRAKARPPYILVGHSLGGLNVRLYASRHPAEVAGLVLVDATPVGFPVWFENSGVPRTKMGTLLSVSPGAARLEFESLQESAEQVRGAPPPEGIPVIVVSSARPEETESFRETWRKMQHEMARRLGASQHRVSDSADHYIQYGAPELIIEAIDRITETIGSSPSAPH